MRLVDGFEFSVPEGVDPIQAQIDIMDARVGLPPSGNVVDVRNVPRMSYEDYQRHGRGTGFFVEVQLPEQQ